MYKIPLLFLYTLHPNLASPPLIHPVPAGFAFVYMCDRRDAEDSIRKLDDTEFGYKRRRLKVQWANVGGEWQSPRRWCLACVQLPAFTRAHSRPRALTHASPSPPCPIAPSQQSESDRKRDVKPSTTIFVVNFDVNRVRERDLERHFEYYGRISRIEIKRNYAFIQVGRGKGLRGSSEGGEFVSSLTTSVW